MSRFTLAGVRVGRARPFGPQGQPSAIDKQPVPGPVLAGAPGLAGDEQGDPRHHGGPDKAVHAYAAANLPRWAADLPDLAALFRPGAFGENLTVTGIDEAAVCLGDRWRVGGAVMEVSQGRQPCWKLNVRFGRPDMARLVQRTGRTGWYFRVLEPGPVAAGDGAVLLDRLHPGWSLARVSDLLYRGGLDPAALAEFAALPGLPENWRRLARARLASGRVEDWSARIDTPRG